MNERDELDDELEALGRLQREREGERESAWDHVATGARDVDEVRRERLAAGDDPAQVELGAALFRPFDAQDDDALAELLLREAVRDESLPSNVRTLPSNVRTLPGNVQTLPSNMRPLPRLGWLFPVLALAAVLALALLLGPLLSPMLGSRGQQLAQLDPPPTYTVELHGSVELVRSDPTPTQRPVLAPATEFEWVLRPQLDAHAVAVRVFAVSATGSVRTLELGDAITSAPSGAVRISGRGQDLGLESGPWQIVIALAYERAALPSTPSTPTTSWRSVEFELEVLLDPAPRDPHGIGQP